MFYYTCLLKKSSRIYYCANAAINVEELHHNALVNTGIERNYEISDIFITAKS